MSRTGRGKIVVFFHDEGDNKIYPIGLTKEQEEMVNLMQTLMTNHDKLRVVDEPLGEFVDLKEHLGGLKRD